MDETLNAGRFLIRLGLGLMLIAHGANKVVGKGGIAGTARWFDGSGRLASRLDGGGHGGRRRHAHGSRPGFPVPCAGVVALMTVAALTDHRGKGVFVFKGGWEYVAVVGVIASAVAFTGPGRWSLDHLIGLRLYASVEALVATCVGLLSAVGTVAGFRRPPATEKAA